MPSEEAVRLMVTYREWLVHSLHNDYNGARYCRRYNSCPITTKFHVLVLPQNALLKGALKSS
jgi:hypothetical protein